MASVSGLLHTGPALSARPARPPHLLVEMNGWVIPTQEKHGLQLVPNLDSESREI